MFFFNLKLFIKKVNWFNFETNIKIILFLILFNLIFTILTMYLVKIQKYLKTIKKRIKSK